MEPPASSSPRSFLSGGDEAGALIRAHDWTATPLGPPESWPQPLKTVVTILLMSNQPMFVAWGPQRTLLYNDAYAAILATKHPAALGHDFVEVWEEIRSDLLPIVEKAYHGRPVQMDDIELVVQRRGYPEEAHFSFFYAPVRDENGAVGGLYCACTETTGRVLAQRRRSFLADLDAQLRELSDPREITARAQQALGTYLKASRVGYGEVDASQRYFTTEANWTDGTVPPRHGTHDLAAFGDWVWDGLKNSERLVVRDVRQDPRTSSPEALAAFAGIEAKAALTVSLVKAGKLRAALYVHHREPQAWSDADAQLVEQVAERTWAAVERTQAEQRLRLERDRSRRVLEGMTEGFLLMDRDFRVLQLNAEGMRLEQRSPDDIVGKTHWEAWPGTQASPLGQAYQRAMRDRVPVAMEHRYEWPDGHHAWLDMRAYPVEDGLAVFYRDVTERRHAEEQLRESNARFELLASTISKVFYINEVDEGRIAYVSPAYAAVWEQPLERLYADPTAFLEPIHPDDRSAVIASLERQKQGERAELRYRLDFGERVKWVRDRSFPVNEVASGALRIVGIVEDITEQHTRDLMLTRRSAQLQQLAQTALDVAAAPDLDATLEVITEAARRIIGAHQAVASLTKGADWSQAINAVALTGKYAAWRDYAAVPDGTGIYAWVCQQNKPARFTQAELEAHPHWRGFGDHRREHPPMRGWLAAPLVGRDGRNLGLVQLSDKEDRSEFDESDEAMLIQLAQLASAAVEQNLAETALRELNFTLETRVAEEVAERAKAEDALRQAQKMEAVGQLTGGIAHDFNNLLTVIQGSAELLGRPNLSDERRKRYIDAISETADRAAKLTGQLLAFARRQPLQPERFDASTRITAIAGMLRTILGSRIKVLIDAECPDCFVEADPGQFETALVNLAVNARDAMNGEGELRLCIEARNGSEPGLVAVIVADTGIGIPPEHIARLFEPFFTTKDVGKGTGLGLSQVYGFAKQSGGDVLVDSQAGAGAIFTLLLPKVKPEADERSEPARQAHVPDGSGRILVVEDDPLVGEFAAQALADLGYETAFAADAAEAIQVAEREAGRFDLVFTDVVMPGGDGVALATAITERWNIPVILTSGYSEVLARGVPARFPLLQKPYTVEAMAQAIANASARRPRLRD